MKRSSRAARSKRAANEISPKKDYSHLPPQYRPENLSPYQIELHKKTYTVLCKGTEIWSGDIKEIGLRKGDSKKTKAMKIGLLIAGYLLKRQ